MLNSGEIDLWQLISNCYTFLKANFKVASFFILASLLLCVANIFLYPNIYKPYYRINFEAKSAIESYEAIEEIINSIPSTYFPPQNQAPLFRRIKAATSTNIHNEKSILIKLEVLNPNTISHSLQLIEKTITENIGLKQKYILFHTQQKALLNELNKQLSKTDTLIAPNSNYIALFEKKLAVEKTIAPEKLISFTTISYQPNYCPNWETAMAHMVIFGCIGTILGLSFAIFMNRFFKRSQ